MTLRDFLKMCKKSAYIEIKLGDAFSLPNRPKDILSSSGLLDKKVLTVDSTVIGYQKENEISSIVLTLDLPEFERKETEKKNIYVHKRIDKFEFIALTFGSQVKIVWIFDDTTHYRKDAEYYAVVFGDYLGYEDGMMDTKSVIAEAIDSDKCIVYQLIEVKEEINKEE